MGKFWNILQTVAVFVIFGLTFFLKKKRLKLPSLFLITGDHGMRDTGGHGGSTFGEINVPLMVVGVGCRQTE